MCVFPTRFYLEPPRADFHSTCCCDGGNLSTNLVDSRHSVSTIFFTYAAPTSFTCVRQATKPWPHFRNGSDCWKRTSECVLLRRDIKRAGTQHGEIRPFIAIFNNKDGGIRRTGFSKRKQAHSLFLLLIELITRPQKGRQSVL